MNRFTPEEYQEMAGNLPRGEVGAYVNAINDIEDAVDAARRFSNRDDGNDDAGALWGEIESRLTALLKDLGEMRK